MTANANDMFQKVSRSTATTLSAPGYTIGATSINVASTSNWPADTGITFGIDEVDGNGNRINGTYNIFRGTVGSATQLANLTYVGGDANRNYSAGATTRVYILVSYARENRLVDGLLVSHDQDGTLKTDSVDSTQIKADAITTPKIADGAVTGSKITNYKIVRQDDTTNSTEATSRILTGWGVIPINTGTRTYLETVTFNTAFTGRPIVVGSCGGDGLTANGSTYGKGGSNIVNGWYCKVVEITTSSFQVYLATEAGNPGAAGYLWYQWIAIGV